MAYAAVLTALERRAAAYVDKILDPALHRRDAYYVERILKGTQAA